MNSTDFEARLSTLQARCNRALTVALGEPGSEFNSSAAPLLKRLFQAGDYALNTPGKRIRPALVYAAAAAVDAQAIHHPALDGAACAVEMVHAYSLTHDDLPSMDDDDLRRGRPTVHKAFDEATAILAGDALQARAFELLANLDKLDAARRSRLVAILAAASGPRGMVGGQAIDIDATDQTIGMESLQAMHALKTGALIRVSVAMGATVAGADEGELSQLDLYAHNIGLAFQIRDDVLNATSDTDDLGKRAGSDVAHNKSTYVSLLGVEGARAKSAELMAESVAALSGFPGQTGLLLGLARYIVDRTK